MADYQNILLQRPERADRLIVIRRRRQNDVGLFRPPALARLRTRTCVKVASLRFLY